MYIMVKALLRWETLKFCVVGVSDVADMTPLIGGSSSDSSMGSRSFSLSSWSAMLLGLGLAMLSRSGGSVCVGSSRRLNAYLF